MFNWTDSTISSIPSSTLESRTESHFNWNALREYLFGEGTQWNPSPVRSEAHGAWDFVGWGGGRGSGELERTF